MPDDFYPDAAAPSETGDQTPPENTGEESAKGDDDKQAEPETALLPKSLLGGKEFKPGEEVVFKIVRFYDDEVEVAYATGEGDEGADAGGKGYGGGDEMAKAEGKLSSMAGGGY